MSASQERQPTLDSVAPRFLVGEMEQALAFYGQLGFVTTYHDEGFAIVERDGVALHFNASDSEEPPKDHLLGWNSVTKSKHCISSMCRRVPFSLHSRLSPGA